MGKWIEIKEVDGWEYVHEKQARGTVWCVIKTRDDYVILRNEPIPCHDACLYYAVGGMMDESDATPFDAVIREIDEEVGLNILNKITKQFSTVVYKNKITSTPAYIYYFEVDICYDDVHEAKPKTDGSEHEANCQTVMIKDHELNSIIYNQDDIIDASLTIAYLLGKTK